MKKLCYSKRGAKAHDGFTARSAAYFASVENGVDEVVIVGDYQNIKDAYTKAEVKVTVEDVETDAKKDKPLGVADLRKLLTDAGVEFPADAKKPELQALVDAMDKGE